MPALLLIVNNIVLVSYIPRTSQAVPWKVFWLFGGCSAAAVATQKQKDKDKKPCCASNYCTQLS